MTRPTRPSSRTAAMLTLALAGAAAHAQSSVNISGTIDIAAFRGFDGIAINKGTQVGSLSRSDLTFSGKEDLGNGLATTFKLSTRFEPDTGSTENSNKPFWYGESTVGLKGSFGHVRLGRAMEAVTANDWAFDPWDNFDRLASPAWQFWHYNYAVDRHGSTTGGSEYFRLNNGVFFDSANYSGFSLSANTSFEKNTTANVGTGKPYGLAFKYGGNGFNAALSFGRNADGDTVKFLGLKQNFGALTVMGAYDISTWKGTTANSTAHATTLGATYQLSTVLLQGSVGRLSYGDVHNEMAAVGARYPLSKRTYVYGDLSHLKVYEKDGSTGYGVGINHSF